MRKYLALFVAGNIIGRDGLGFWIGICMEVGRHHSTGRTWEYHGIGDRDASP